MGFSISGAISSATSAVSSATSAISRKFSEVTTINRANDAKKPGSPESKTSINYRDRKRNIEDNLSKYKTVQWPSTIGTMLPGETSPQIPYVMAFFINANGRSKAGFAANADNSISQQQFDVDYTNKKQGFSANNINKTLNDLEFKVPASPPTRESNESDESYSKRLSSEADTWYNDNKMLITAKEATDKMKALLVPTTKRLQETIILPMPLELSYSDSVSYNDAGLGGVIGSLVKSIGNAGVADSITNLGAAGIVEATKLGMNAGVSALGAVGVDAEKLGVRNIDGIFDKAVGAVINPRLEQVFQQANFREFTFNWQLAAKSEQEAEDIRYIIQVFRENMYPELGDISSGGVGSFLVMPNEFDIEFYEVSVVSESGEYDMTATKKTKFRRNTMIPRLASCVITQCSTNFTPHGYWSALKNGQSPIVSLSLSFKEVEPINRDLIKEGF